MSEYYTVSEYLFGRKPQRYEPQNKEYNMAGYSSVYDVDACNEVKEGFTTLSSGLSQRKRNIDQNVPNKLMQTTDQLRDDIEPSMSMPMEIKTKSEIINTNDPKVWGPFYWTSLHISSVYYPDDPSPIVMESMKNRILAIPYEIPCNECRKHAISFIEANRGNLDKIVSSRKNLIKFYTDFHNKVNQRYGKPTWSYEDVEARYGGKAKLTYASTN